MRNERELYRIRIVYIDWINKVIFVPDSKTPTGRHKVPMSDRVLAVLSTRCAGRKDGWVFQSKRADSGHRTTTMGHKDVRTAMRYQHPELDIVREALNTPRTMMVQ